MELEPEGASLRGGGSVRRSRRPERGGRLQATTNLETGYPATGRGRRAGTTHGAACSRAHHASHSPLEGSGNHLAGREENETRPPERWAPERAARGRRRGGVPERSSGRLREEAAAGRGLQARQAHPDCPRTVRGGVPGGSKQESAFPALRVESRCGNAPGTVLEDVGGGRPGGRVHTSLERRAHSDGHRAFFGRKRAGRTPLPPNR